MVVEGALEGELDDHLGYGKHDVAGRDGGNSRNGYRVDLPRTFRTADLWLIHAADCRSRYSSWTCCGVRY